MLLGSTSIKALPETLMKLTIERRNTVCLNEIGMFNEFIRKLKENKLKKGNNSHSGADAIKKFTPSLGIPYFGV